MAQKWVTFFFQESESPLMNDIVSFNYYTFSYVVAISVFVALLTASLVFNKSLNSIDVSRIMEIIWTFVPVIILCLLAFPSLRLLYSQDEILNPNSTCFAVAHQWYWSYENPTESLNYDSYMKSNLECNYYGGNSYRLLDVDNRMTVKIKDFTRMLITSADVLHSWTIPSLGLKADAVPGRLNSLPIFVARPSVLYGQCSEICGTNHSFMPICLEAN